LWAGASALVMRLHVPAIVWLLAICCGAGIGVCTNVINASVSSTYFQAILGITPAEVRLRVPLQGIFEGGALGFFFGLILALAISVITRQRCPLSLALNVLIRVMLIALVCWVIGGACGVLLAALAPTFYRVQFNSVPADFAGMLRYAWVGGSIWGAYAAALIGAAWGTFWIYKGWKRFAQPVGFSITSANEARQSQPAQSVPSA
jgi:hypothetical protein